MTTIIFVDLRELMGYFGGVKIAFENADLSLRAELIASKINERRINNLLVEGDLALAVEGDLAGGIGRRFSNSLCKNTLAEYMILSDADNRPPMLDKDLTKKYAELSAAKKIQADCDMKATNIILQGLPANIYSLVNHHKVSKDLWERVQCKLHTHLKRYELHANEVRLLRERNQDTLAFDANQQITPPYFNTYESSYYNPQLQQQFSPSKASQYGPIHHPQHYSST
nr:hypothetical protein [Tanacetum cinerariifolium]